MIAAPSRHLLQSQGQGLRVYGWQLEFDRLHYAVFFACVAGVGVAVFLYIGGASSSFDGVCGSCLEAEAGVVGDVSFFELAFFDVLPDDFQVGWDIVVFLFPGYAGIGLGHQGPGIVAAAANIVGQAVEILRGIFFAGETDVGDSEHGAEGWEGIFLGDGGFAEAEAGVFGAVDVQVNQEVGL